MCIVPPNVSSIKHFELQFLEFKFRIIKSIMVIDCPKFGIVIELAHPRIIPILAATPKPIKIKR